MRNRSSSFTVVLAAVALFAAAMVWAAPAYLIGDRWLVAGTGFAERGFLRVSMTAEGTLDVTSIVSGDVEYVTGYHAQAELNATQLGISAWDFDQSYTLPTPIPVVDFNPTVNEPFTLPAFTVDRITYRVELTSVNSGKIRIQGIIDVDMVGDCEVNADCALWRQGTPRPNLESETDSGCGIGTAWPGIFAAAFFLLGSRRRPI